MPVDPPPPVPHRDPLHGRTLEAFVAARAAHYGWDGLRKRIPVRCFTSDPGLASSLKFLRRTPWARDKVEGLYLFILQDARRAGRARRAAGPQPKAPRSSEQGEPPQGPRPSGGAGARPAKR
jgi:uncharacterized protein (DUF2132 family)